MSINSNRVRIDSISGYVHNTLKLYCEIFKNDHTKSYWKSAPEWQVKATYQLVKEVLSGEGLSAEDRHNLWVDNLKSQGVVYGKEKTFFNEKLLTHPSLVPYNELSDFEKSKDDLVNFLVNEFDEYLKNREKNIFELYLIYEVSKGEASFSLKTENFLLSDFLLILKKFKITSVDIKSYMLLVQKKDKYHRLLNVEKFK